MRWKTMMWCATIILAISGCASPKKSIVFVDDSQRVIPVMPGDTLTTIEGDVIIDFRGVLIPRGRFMYLLRCEDYVIKQGVLP